MSLAPRLCALVGLVLVAIGVLAGWDALHIGNDPAPCARGNTDWQADAALVLSGAPHLRRTRVAVAAYRNGHISRIMISGAGSGGDSARAVAAQAERVLDLPHGLIRLENRARSTAQNLAFSCPLLRGLGARRIALVTDDWHMQRAYATAGAECSPLSFCSLPSADPVTPKRRRHETLALLAYQLSGRALWFWW